MIRIHATGLTAILAKLGEIGHALDLDRDDLGPELMDIAAEEVAAAMDRQEDPDGSPWAPLAPRTAAAHHGQPIGERTGLMKSPDQLAGERHVSAESAEMTYGITPAAKVEAIKFTFGGLVTGTNQPPRPFYGLTRQAVARCVAACEKRLAQASEWRSVR